MKWDHYAHFLIQDFGITSEELEIFLKTQDAIWTEEFAKNFLEFEYGGEIPRESPLVIIPQNIPHLLFQELRISEVAGWSPTFYISESLPGLRRLSHHLKLDLKTRLPQKFPHVRSYGRRRLGIATAVEVFHGSWVGVYDVSQGANLSLFSEMLGRGCLSPLLLTGALEKLITLKEISRVHPGNEHFELAQKFYLAAGEVDQLLRFGNSHVSVIRDPSKAYHLAYHHPSPGVGGYYYCETIDWTLPRILDLNRMGPSITTVPEKCIKL